MEYVKIGRLQHIYSYGEIFTNERNAGDFYCDYCFLLRFFILYNRSYYKFYGNCYTIYIFVCER